MNRLCFGRQDFLRVDLDALEAVEEGRRLGSLSLNFE